MCVSYGLLYCYFNTVPIPEWAKEKNGHFSVRTHAHISDTPSTQQKSVEHGKMLLLTMYGEFRVPVDFIQANGFIQFHLC